MKESVGSSSRRLRLKGQDDITRAGLPTLGTIWNGFCSDKQLRVREGCYPTYQGQVQREAEEGRREELGEVLSRNT